MEDKWVQDILKELELGAFEVKPTKKGENKMNWFYVRNSYTDKRFVNLEQIYSIQIEKSGDDLFTVTFIPAAERHLTVKLTGGEVNALLIALKK